MSNNIIYSNTDFSQSVCLQKYVILFYSLEKYKCNFYTNLSLFLPLVVRMLYIVSIRDIANRYHLDVVIESTRNVLCMLYFSFLLVAIRHFLSQSSCSNNSDQLFYSVAYNYSSKWQVDFILYCYYNNTLVF